MQLIEIEIIYHEPQPPSRDWIQEDQLKETLDDISRAGLGARIIGPVSWQRQLAQMESPTI